MNLSSSILNQLVASYALKQDYIEQLSDYYKKQWIQFKKLLIEYGLTEFEEPKGGIFVKINLSKSINIEKLVKNGGDKGVTIEENKFCYTDNKNRPYIRLNFVNNSIGTNKKAISILAKEIEKLKQFI